nr:MAG TPA: hypothetical protein [Crassvirales sp.]DAU12253.1 MAG TPA: hypothetical protein [Caudoviricetes sp.]
MFIILTLSNLGQFSIAICVKFTLFAIVKLVRFLQFIIYTFCKLL